MQRRSFLTQAAMSALGTVVVPGAWSQSPPTATLKIGPAAQPRVVPRSFTGLSYELAQLTEPSLFSKENSPLVTLFRLLSPDGLLRLGGNTSEFCWFQANAETQPPALHSPMADLDKNWMPHRLFAIKPEAIDTLAGFLEATGWRAIYGVNLGNSSPQRAAEEAAYVAAKLGPRLAFFQIGNEPDFYHDANNGTRPPAWTFEDYVKEWTAFADAISARVPQARFGAPDVGASSQWVTRFGQEAAAQLGPRLVALSAHYYAEGPPDSPNTTTARLLAGDPRVTSSTEAIVRTANAHSLNYHMTEGNSCYRGGKPGMSNAFAASLWAADYMLLLASLGCAGVNLHGGDSRFLSAGLGDHNPGMKVATGHQAAPNGFYTPIATEAGQTPAARPVFYGMLLAQQFAGGTVLKADLQTTSNVTAYAVENQGTTKVAIFNKGADASVSVDVQCGTGNRSGSLWTLEAPALSSEQGITLGGSSIDAAGRWNPRAGTIPVKGGQASLHLPASSAALLALS